MNLRGLSFDAMPPFAVPYQFFITAPAFMVVIGLLWLFSSPFELTSRWTTLALATTHGITLGFMMMVMFGALFQVLPVVTGIAMPQAIILSKFVHRFLLVGVICLISGFILVHHYLLAIGALAILLALIIFMVGLFMRFPQMRNSPTSWAIRLAAVSLLITIGMGVAFIVGWIDPSLFPSYRAWTNTHMLWGFSGWTLLLVMGVSFQIIPMFYVTPDYPKWVSHFLPAAIFIQLVLLSVDKLFSENTSTIKLQLILLTVTALSYAIFTLYLLSKRKRKALDITIWFWNLAMTSFIIAGILFIGRLFYIGEYLAQIELVLGAILLVGFALALITGMLLKIVPFLVWLNIQQKWIKHPSIKMPLSNMQQVIPIKVAKRQFYLFILMLPTIALVFSGFTSIWIIKLAAIQLILTFGYLFYHLYKAKLLHNTLDAGLDNEVVDEPSPMKAI